MLTILSMNICISYLPYYAFVPILRQGMQVYGVDESSLNLLCIFYALVYVPGAFLTGPLVGAIGCQWTFMLAMAINALGCAVRCGEDLLSFIFPWMMAATPAEILLNANATDVAVVVSPQLLSFPWLVVGQLLCAMAQPLLVNATSEMGAEWFPPHERPRAAMVSNLMNFIGSSLSFMMPPVFVDGLSDSIEFTEIQVHSLLRSQFQVALFALTATLLFYRQPPQSAAHGAGLRPAATFRSEVLWVLCLRDFWLVTAQFSIYVAIGHAFDAVEGSLLEHYGYSAALTSWTGLACAVASIFSTVVESRYITDAAQYRVALLVANAFVASALLLGFFCLQLQMHPYVFVAAVGILGLSTPGWGCSCEFASEVCYPARETTVSSLLEAFSNMLGVAGILVTQRLIDAGFGAIVTLLMAAAAVISGSLLLCTRGRLLRTLAESSSAEEYTPPSLDVKVPSGRVWVNSLGSRCERSCEKRRPRVSGICKGPTSYIAVTMTGACLLLMVKRTNFAGGDRFDRLPWVLSATRLPPDPPPVASLPPWSVPPPLANRSRVQTLVMHCSEDQLRIDRFRRCLRDANLSSFDVVRCNPSRVIADDVEVAVRQGLLPPSALMALTGLSRLGMNRTGLLDRALSHLKIMRDFINSPWSMVNIMDSDEVFFSNYAAKRAELLGKLPHGFDFVNLNAVRPAGDKLRFKVRKPKKGQPKDAGKSWMNGRVFRMRSGLSPWTNEHLGNYIITKRGAKKILKIGSRYNTFGKWEAWGNFLLSQIYEGGDFVGFSVARNLLSFGSWSKRTRGNRARNASKTDRQPLCTL